MGEGEIIIEGHGLGTKEKRNDRGDEGRWMRQKNIFGCVSKQRKFKKFGRLKAMKGEENEFT